MLQTPSRLLTHRQRSHEIKTTFNKRIRGQRRALSPQPLYDSLHTWLGDIGELIDREVDALGQGTAVNPFFSRMPAFHGGRIEQTLAHGHCRGGQVVQSRFWKAVRTDKTHKTRDQFIRAFDPFEACGFKEIGVE